MNCVSCRETIKDGATICGHCGTHQNWHRHISKANVLLGILVMLLAVLPTGSLYELISGRNSEITLSPGPSNTEYISLLATNDGNRSGTISNVKLSFLLKDSAGTQKNSGITLSIRGFEDGKAFIKADETRQVFLRYRNSRMLSDHIKRLAPFAHSGSATCLFQISIINYDATIKNEQFQFNCKKYFGEYFDLNREKNISISPGELTN